MRRRRLCYVVSSAMTVAAFLRPQVVAAAERYDVVVMANLDRPDALDALNLPARIVAVPIERPIAPWRDLRALFALWRHFRRERFDLVHSVTPKAGLLAMLAAWGAGVPHRVHTFTGQVWATRRGVTRALLKTADRLIGALSTRALVDSPSQRDFLVAQGVLAVDRSDVAGRGSICGVDTARFHPDAAARAGLRQELGVPDDAVVALFVGRMNREKGLLDLAAAFAALAESRPHLYLLLVGPDEEGLLPAVSQRLGAHAGRLRHVGYTNCPEGYMAAADIFCLPSYREGFGQVLVEAAAVGLPAVASRIYGITDAVADGETGLLHAAADAMELGAALARLADDADLRRHMGAAARRCVAEQFAAATVTAALMAFYGRLLGT